MKHTYTLDEIFDTLEIAISMSNGNKQGIHNNLNAAKGHVEDLLAEKQEDLLSVAEGLREIIREYK